MRLVETLGGALEHFDIHALFTGANKAGAAGMRAFLARGTPSWGRGDTTIFLNVDQVGSGGELRERGGTGHAAIAGKPRICDQIAEDDHDAGPLVSRSASDASGSSAAGFAAITVTCRDGLDYASGRVEGQARGAPRTSACELIEAPRRGGRRRGDGPQRAGGDVSSPPARRTSRARRGWRANRGWPPAGTAALQDPLDRHLELLVRERARHLVDLVGSRRARGAASSARAPACGSRRPARRRARREVTTNSTMRSSTSTTRLSSTSAPPRSRSRARSCPSARRRG